MPFARPHYDSAEALLARDYSGLGRPLRLGRAAKLRLQQRFDVLYLKRRYAYRGAGLWLLVVVVQEQTGRRRRVVNDSERLKRRGRLLKKLLYAAPLSRGMLRKLRDDLIPG